VKYTVEVRYTGVDWADLMADMRAWLDRRKIKVEEFSHSLLGRSVTVHVGFHDEDRAAAFATSFSGQLQPAVRKTISCPAESDPGSRISKRSAPPGDPLLERAKRPQKHHSLGSL
jgi:hypothetical protein